MSATQEQFILSRLPSPIGVLLVATDAEARLRVLDFSDYEERMHQLMRRRYGADGVRLVEGPAPASIAEPIAAYFDGELAAIDAIPTKTAGTPFQLDAWAALRAIPAGTISSYGAQAVRIGRPAAVRAVGLANGANPIGIVVPCHRVIGANASLTGYGGGIERKRWLLAHEGVEIAETAGFSQRQAELALQP
jgi:methylated-DNA-[protein]-cysteine S-methyltransferase